MSAATNGKGGHALQADAAEIGAFYDALFRYADEGSFISLRAFDQRNSGKPAVLVKGIKINGDAGALVKHVADVATRVANRPEPTVFAPPVCTFTRPDKATVADIANGIALSVDLDSACPAAGRERLEGVLGPATIVVASGGEWMDPETGQLHDKVHLHWRLTEPTRTTEDHAKLREARRLAALLVGGDLTAAPLVHPLRMAGSWNLKTRPGRLAKIIDGNEAAEIDLEEAVERLGEAVEAAGLALRGRDGPRAPGEPQAPLATVISALQAIPNDSAEWEQWNHLGMAVWRATGGSDEGLEAWAAWSAKSDKHDEDACIKRWQHFGRSPPSKLGAGTIIYMARAAGWQFPRGPAAKPATHKPDTDVMDWLHSRAANDATEAPRRKGHGAAATADTRPEIIIQGGNISAEVDAAETALVAGGSGIYQRGRILVQTGMVSVEISNDRKTRGLHVLPVEEHALLEAMTRTARWLKMDGRSKEPREVNAPTLAVKVYLDRVGKWKLPVLTGIVSAPTLRADGSVLSTPGYDSATGLIFDACGETFQPVPDQPTRADALAALEALKKPIREFPFVKQADQSVALSAFLTAVIRRSLRTAPLHGFTAPAAGTGKSKLADMASILATGREAGTIAQSGSSDEFEKRLGAMLLAAENVIAIDNCEHPLGGEFLCQVMTQPIVRVRILGASKMPEVLANSLVTATGNNLTLSGDMNRRALLCSLDAKCERPEMRVFGEDPVEVAKADRHRLIAAALTVLRAYHVAGRPKQAEPLGSFAEWSRWVRDALLWLGEADPVSTMEETRKMDPVLEALADVMQCWDRAFGTGRVTTKDVIARANMTRTSEAFGRPEPVDPELRDALLGVAGKGGAINPRALGKWLSQHRGRVVGGRRFDQQGILHGAVTWGLEKIA